VTANHDAIVRNFERLIPRAAAMHVPNVITFFGNRRGMSDGTAIDNCVMGLNRVKTIAEESGVTICVELLNSKVNHPDYQGYRTHEFVPTRDPLKSLAEAVALCDV